MSIASTLVRDGGLRMVLVAAMVVVCGRSSFAADRSIWEPLSVVPQTSLQSEPASADEYAPRIFNGTPTGDYPAVAAVGIKISQVEFGLCSGTLIAPTVVMTAAHCVDQPPLAVAVAFLVNDQQQNYRVDTVAIHPRHVAGTVIADLALLKLATPVEGVTPVPLAHARPRPGRTGMIVGFGEDSSGQVGRQQVGTVRVGRCPGLLRHAGIRKLANLVCWRADRGGSGTCEGDSGGPLLVNGSVAGVTSASTSAFCGPSRVDLDTSVAAYRSWIDQALQ